MKYERIDESILSKLDYEYRNASYIYSILNTGYYYENKILKRGVTDEEVAKLNEENLAGVDVLLTWERIYPYRQIATTYLVQSIFTSQIFIVLKF